MLVAEAVFISGLGLGVMYDFERTLDEELKMGSEWLALARAGILGAGLGG